MDTQKGKSFAELCFRPLVDGEAVYAFACNANGDVDYDAMSKAEQRDYLYAIVLVGRRFHVPYVRRLAVVTSTVIQAEDRFLRRRLRDQGTNARIVSRDIGDARKKKAVAPWFSCLPVDGQRHETPCRKRSTPFSAGRRLEPNVASRPGRFGRPTDRRSTKADLFRRPQRGTFQRSRRDPRDRELLPSRWRVVGWRQAGWPSVAVPCAWTPIRLEDRLHARHIKRVLRQDLLSVDRRRRLFVAGLRCGLYSRVALA